MKVKSFQGGYDKNFSYLIWCPKTKLAAIIDPSTEINPIIEHIEENNLILSKIIGVKEHIILHIIPLAPCSMDKKYIMNQLI